MSRDVDNDWLNDKRKVNTDKLTNLSRDEHNGWLKCSKVNSDKLINLSRDEHNGRLKCPKVNSC